jgi:hypothetical protein
MAEDSTAAGAGGNLPRSKSKASTINHVEKTVMRGANKKFESVRGFVFTAILGAVLTVTLVSCGHSSSPQQLTQQTFASAQEASRALFAAVRRNDEQALMRILGGGKQLVSCGDKVEDKLERELFVRKYRQMHRLVREADFYVRLYIGAENWPFPVPLTSKNGRWYFDSKVGLHEILYRRIGENESIAIEACNDLVRASEHHNGIATADDPVVQYARTLVSGQVKTGNVAAMNNEQSPGPFYGYYYRMLSRGRNGTVLSRGMRGGMVFVVYPARYRLTGVMTFIVARDNVVYEKDLGPNSTKTAESMTGWKPDSSWHVAD